MMDVDPRERIAGWSVRDVMSSPMRTCFADLPLVDAAQRMAAEHIHCLAVVSTTSEDEVDGFLGILSDIDLVAALEAGSAFGTAGEFAASSVDSVMADAPLGEAVHQMHESRAHHLVVVARGSGRPVGILSTLDILETVAGAG